MQRIIASLILVGVFSWVNFGQAEMSSSNYIIRWDTVGTGGSDTSSSASYELRDTVGNAGIGDSDSASYQLAAGYRNGVFDQVITFDVFVQDASVHRTALSSAGTTITVSSSSGFSAGEHIALIQDEGAGQISAIGKVTSVSTGSITVDALKDAGVTPSIDGSNDFVYHLSTTSASFGDLDPSVFSTEIVALIVTSDVDGGYVVQVYDDGNLRHNSDDIDDVADAAVTTGSEEFGGRSSDVTLANSTFDTADTAFTTSFQDVADESSTSFDSRNFVTLKASITALTPDGNYAQNQTYIVSGNF